jgi:hypothetical protein
MGIVSSNTNYRSFLFPIEDGYNSEAAEENGLVLEDLDSGESDNSDESFVSGLSDHSDISDEEGFLEAERADEEYFAPEVKFAPVYEAHANPSLFNRVTNGLKIGLATVCIGSVLLYPLLLNANKSAAAAGMEHGKLEGEALTRYAVSYVASFAQENIAAMWDQFIRSINN